MRRCTNRKKTMAGRVNMRAAAITWLRGVTNSPMNDASPFEAGHFCASVMNVFANRYSFQPSKERDHRSGGDRRGDQWEHDLG